MAKKNIILQDENNNKLNPETIITQVKDSSNMALFTETSGKISTTTGHTIDGVSITDSSITADKFGSGIANPLGEATADLFKLKIGDLIYSLQSEITAQNPLSADLVSDTNANHKFVTASEKARITANQQAIAGIKDGQSVDSFADVESALDLKLDNTTFEALGLSVIDGCLCQTYQEE